ncbi:hypothetical protein [Colwellia psychrerythraea]|uniref:Uncharacterized protein n=1 Tax=Colwellia psychrerythraea TaxID=28229 RepID=A0A099KFQ8_COLPS|nr:hypothetical protein [Colwellia psychrerythraea]KGJ89181.1 hypothetical protein GAB14E_4177 [Colwellia psychrerythraea]
MNVYLLIAGSLTAIAALLHLACIYFGAPWYRFFGAGEQMALMAEQGYFYPTLVTLAIFLILSLWSAYAFSAAGLIIRLPFLRLVMSLITLIYLTRGVAGFTLIDNPMGRTPEFWLWSSGICLTIGIFHAVGLQQLKDKK